MGLSFKKIGKALKGVTKAISLKNGLKIVNGDYRGVVEEVQGRVKKGIVGLVKKEADNFGKKLTGGLKSGSNQPDKLTKNEQYVQDVLVSQAEQHITPFIDKQKESLANYQTGQQVSSFLTKQYLLTMWSKYKTYIIIGGVAVVTLIFRKKIFGNKGRR